MMNRKETFYFIGKCLALDENPDFRDQVYDLSSRGEIDWEQFVEISSDHLVLPVIYLKFKTHDILKFIPEELGDFLRQTYELNVERNKQIRKQAIDIVKVLNENNIEPVFLKGTAFILDRLYSDIGERILADIDFLVSEEQFLKTARILKDVGYSQVHPKSIPTKTFKHFPRIVHPDFIADVEIHKFPVDLYYRHLLNEEMVLRDKKHVSEIEKCFVPSENHKVIHNFVHGQLGDGAYYSGKVSLRDIYDLLLLSRRISFNDIVSSMKYKQKITAYFAFSSKVLNLDDLLFKKKNFAFKLLLESNSLCFREGRFYSFIRNLFIITRLIQRTISELLFATFNRERRVIFLLRLRKSDYRKMIKRLLG